MSNAHSTEPQGTTPEVARFLAPETHPQAGFGTTLYAQPYNIAATGFQFHDLAEFESKAEALRDDYGNPVEEFEIQYLEGDDGELFAACGIHQGNLSTWFDEIEPMDDDRKVALYALVGEIGYTLDNAMDKVDDVCIFRGDAEEAAEELFDDCYSGSIPENLRFYFDMAKFARDLVIGGDFNEFRFDGETYTVTNASGI